MVYVNMAQRVIVPPTVVQLMAIVPPDFTAVVNGHPYAWVYRVDAAIEPIPEMDEEDKRGLVRRKVLRSQLVRPTGSSTDLHQIADSRTLARPTRMN